MSVVDRRWQLVLDCLEATEPPFSQGALAEFRARLIRTDMDLHHLEPRPTGQGGRLRQGVAPERRCSIEDPEMRHGRRSKHKRFNGYKRHVATDLDADLILACAVPPANRPEDEAAAPLKADLERQKLGPIDELSIDRGYLSSPVVSAIRKAGGTVLCRPWAVPNGEVFSKQDFKLNLRDKTIP